MNTLGVAQLMWAIRTCKSENRRKHSMNSCESVVFICLAEQYRSFKPNDDPITRANWSSIGLRAVNPGWLVGRFIVLCRPRDGIYLYLCLGNLTALALVCTQTSYMHVSLFTARLTLLPLRIYHFSRTTHTCMTYTKTNTGMHIP